MQNQTGLAAFLDPDFQHALFTAQQASARSGNQDLEDMLIDLLVQRTTARSLSSIVLNEAISIAGKLTDAQLDTLTLALLLVHDPPFRYRFTTLGDFGSYLEKYLGPFIRPAVADNATYLHLKYAGCASLDSGGIGTLIRFQQAFPGCFTLGFERSQANAILHDLLTPCIHVPDRWQFAPMDSTTFRAICVDRGLLEKDIQQSEYIQRNQVMSAEATCKFLVQVFPRIQILFDMQPAFYERGSDFLTDIQLTSVGIALANTNFKRRTAQAFDLNHWIK